MAAKDLYEHRQSYFLQLSPNFRGGLIGCFIIGIIAIAVGAVLAEPTRVWGALLFNVFFFFSIALGGVAFGAMQDVIGALWGRPVRRLHEAFSAFLPLSGVFFLVFLAAIWLDIGGAGSVYVWIADPSIVDHFYGKETWLQKNFMLIRNVFALLVILGLAHWHVKGGLERDAAFVSGDQKRAVDLGNANRDKLRYWSAPVLVVFALCYSLMAFDLLMSLSPMWFSTLFPGWLFAIMMQTLMASILITMFLLQETRVGEIYQRQQFHDVGKLMHGFTIFFAYLTYSHVLTFWYGNLPEETEYLIHRLHAPWIYLVMAAPIFSFVIPLFVLIFKPAKWTKVIALPIALLILAAQWVAYLILVMPETVKGPWLFPWVELGAFLLVLGAFLWSFVRFGQKHPMVPIADPLLQKSLSAHH
jgi:hypothetical protein